MLLRADVEVTACDKRQRRLGGGVSWRAWGRAAPGPDHSGRAGPRCDLPYPGLRPDVPQLLAAVNGEYHLTSEMEFSRSALQNIAVANHRGSLPSKAARQAYVEATSANRAADERDVAGYGRAGAIFVSVDDRVEQSPNIAVVTNLAP